MSNPTQLATPRPLFPIVVLVVVTVLFLIALVVLAKTELDEDNEHDKESEYENEGLRESRKRLLNKYSVIFGHLSAGRYALRLETIQSRSYTANKHATNNLKNITTVIGGYINLS